MSEPLTPRERQGNLRATRYVAIVGTGVLAFLAGYAMGLVGVLLVALAFFGGVALTLATFYDEITRRDR